MTGGRGDRLPNEQGGIWRTSVCNGDLWYSCKHSCKHRGKNVWGSRRGKQGYGQGKKELHMWTPRIVSIANHRDFLGQETFAVHRDFLKDKGFRLQGFG